MTQQAGRAKELFLDALELATPEERQTFLDRECQGDTALRDEVEALLAHHPQVGSFLDSEARHRAETESGTVAVLGPSKTIGPYKVLEQIGEGGFGVVYLAEQSEPIRRKVALKVLKPGMDARPVVARFEAERQALAIMDHPNIARIFDGGTTSSGRPYFVMELVKGVPITEFCDQNHLTARQRLELFVAVCQAVQHAHQKGIIHRDIKPSNVLVTLHDTTPVPKVIDFGIAKALGQELTDKTLFTGFAQLIGTPLYMSPEQAGQSGLDVDTRSDVYSLGVLLYELLTGSTPFTKERFKQGAFEEIRRIICNEEPPSPSKRLSESRDSLPSISAQRRTEPAALTKLVRGELDWIVMKSLEKDRGRRYETANGFAQDVQRYLSHEAVLACPPSALYRLRKFARRNRVAITTTALVAAALLVGTVVSVWKAVEATQARQLADHRSQEAVDARRRAEGNLHLALDALDEIFVSAIGDRIVEEDQAFPPAEADRLSDTQRKLLEKALGFYEQFAEKNANSPEVRADTARAYLRVSKIKSTLGEHQSAIKALEQAAALLEVLWREFPDDPEFGYQLGLSYRYQQTPETTLRAIEVFNEVLPHAPDNPDYRHAMAVALGMSGRREEAAAILEPLVERYPENGAYAISLVINYAKRDRYPDAIELCERVTQRRPEVHDYRQKLGLLCFNHANALMRQKDLDGAERFYRRGIEEYTTVQVTSKGMRNCLDGIGMNQLGLSSVLRLKQLPQEAEEALRKATECYEQLVSFQTEKPWAWRQLGLCYLRLKDHNGTIRAYRTAAELYEARAEAFPNKLNWDKAAQTRLDLADLLRREGLDQQAVAAYEKCLEDREREGAGAAKKARVRYLLSWLLANTSNPGVTNMHRALELAEEAVRLAPEMAAHLDHLAVLLVRSKGPPLRDLTRSIQLAEQATRLAPDIAAYHNSLAWYLIATPTANKLAITRALAEAQKAVELMPMQPKYRRMLGLAHYRAGDWKSAIAESDRATKLGNEADGFALFVLAMAHWQLGEKLLARESFTKAVEWMKKDGSRDLMLLALHPEASELIWPEREPSP